MICSPTCGCIKRSVHGNVQQTASSARHKNVRQRNNSSPITSLLLRQVQCVQRWIFRWAGPLRRMTDEASEVPDWALFSVSKCVEGSYISYCRGKSLQHETGVRSPAFSYFLKNRMATHDWRDSKGSQHWVLSCLRKTYRILCMNCLNPNIWLWGGLLLLFLLGRLFENTSFSK